MENLRKEIFETIGICLINFLRGKSVDVEDLSNHGNYLNTLLIAGQIENNEYDNLQDILETAVVFFNE